MSKWDRMGAEATLEPGTPWSEDTAAAAQERFTMEVVTTSGRAAAVEFRIYADVVEVWHRDRCQATFARTTLRKWLATPETPLVVADVAFTVDRMVDRSGRIALSLPDVVVWTLAPDALAGLRQRL